MRLQSFGLNRRISLLVTGENLCPVYGKKECDDHPVSNYYIPADRYGNRPIAEYSWAAVFPPASESDTSLALPVISVQYDGKMLAGQPTIETSSIGGLSMVADVVEFR